MKSVLNTPECVGNASVRRTLWGNNTHYFSVANTLYGAGFAGLASSYMAGYPIVGWWLILFAVNSCGFGGQVLFRHGYKSRTRCRRYGWLLYALILGSVYGTGGTIVGPLLTGHEYPVFIAAWFAATTLGALVFWGDPPAFYGYLGVFMLPVVIQNSTAVHTMDDSILAACLLYGTMLVTAFVGYRRFWNPIVTAHLDTLHKVRELSRSNRILTRLSSLDPLTALANRRLFDDTLQREWRRAVRTGMPLSVIMLDIDGFKTFNDTYGHLQGDECLRRVSTILRTHANRPADLAARFGGDEFCAIIPDTPLPGALHFAQNVLNGVSQLAIPSTQSPYGQITVSIGVATVQAESFTDHEALLRAADIALYQAKQNGRNCVHAEVTGLGYGEPG